MAGPSPSIQTLSSSYINSPGDFYCYLTPLYLRGWWQSTARDVSLPDTRASQEWCVKEQQHPTQATLLSGNQARVPRLVLRQRAMKVENIHPLLIHSQTMWKKSLPGNPFFFHGSPILWYQNSLTSVPMHSWPHHWPLFYAPSTDRV